MLGKQANNGVMSVESQTRWANINAPSAGTDFIRQNLTYIDRHYTPESDVHRRQILAYVDRHYTPESTDVRI